MTLRDRLADARLYIQDAVDVVSRIKSPEDRLVVKYRDEKHRLNFPYHGEARVGYGALLDLCSEHTIVIGFPGSAAWECLVNGIRFYAFRDFSAHMANRFTDKGAVERLLDIMYVAHNKDELYDNICHKRIYKPGHSKGSLTHQDGMLLHEIVEEILRRQELKATT